MVNAVILAGTGTLRDKVVVKGKNKAFLKLQDRYIISYVIDALKASNVGKIGIVGTKQALEEKVQEARDCEIIEESKHNSRIRNFVENLLNGYKAMRNQEGVFYATSDIPLITPAAINTELKRFRETNSYITLMLTNENIIPQYFRKLKKFYNYSLRLDKQDYRWSNMFFVGGVDVDRLQLDMLDVVGRSFSFRRLDSLESRRKMAFFIFSRFPQQAIKYKLDMLTRDEAEYALYKRFKKKVEILDASSYESVVDIDYEDDLRLVEDYLLSTGTKQLVNAKALRE